MTKIIIFEQNQHITIQSLTIKESFLTICLTQNFFKIKPFGLDKQQLHKLGQKCGKLIILTKIRVKIVFVLAKYEKFHPNMVKLRQNEYSVRFRRIFAVYGFG